MSVTRDPTVVPSHGVGKQDEILRLSESFLAKARMRGDGPRYRKLSRAVRYSMSDLSAWLKACAKTSTAE